jgi:hypothetical protein
MRWESLQSTPNAWGNVLLKVSRPGLVPHSNHASVARPFGFTSPFSVAAVAPTDVAAMVVTDGALPGDAVVKFRIWPSEYPPLFSAQTRKW